MSVGTGNSISNTRKHKFYMKLRAPKFPTFGYSKSYSLILNSYQK